MKKLFSLDQTISLAHKTVRCLGLAAVVSLAGCSAPEMLVRFPAHIKGADIAEYDFGLHHPSVHTYDPLDLATLVKAQQRPEKVDSFLVVIDVQGLQDRTHKGVNSNTYAREVLRRLDRTMPAHSGHRQIYTTATLGNTSETTQFPNKAITLGGGRLPQALEELADHSVKHAGRVAVLLLTDWDRIDKAAEEAVMRLRQRHQSETGLKVTNSDALKWDGKRESGICIYAIGIGNRHSRERLINPEACGAYWAADAVMQPAEMASLVLEILYDRPKDDDGDGIPNYLDQCAMTPYGRTVTSQGCPRFPGKSESKPEFAK